MTPWMGYLFIALQVLSVAMSVYHTNRLLMMEYHKKHHIWHLVFLQAITLLISLIVIAHVLEAISVER